jgi:hypothetical protein
MAADGGEVMSAFDRDEAALRAMEALLRHFDFTTFREDPLRLARWAYEMADCMAVAREGEL